MERPRHEYIRLIAREAGGQFFKETVNFAIRKSKPLFYHFFHDLTLSGRNKIISLKNKAIILKGELEF